MNKLRQILNFVPQNMPCIFEDNCYAHSVKRNTSNFSVHIEYPEYRCALNLNEEYVKIDEIKKIITNSGISLKDHRILSSNDKLKPFINNSQIKTADLINLLKDDDDEHMVFLNRILHRDLVIPDWQSFILHIKDIYQQCISNESGKVATYIPQLAKFSPNYWGVSICTVDGQKFSIGDHKTLFCMQSTSKPITYALALTEFGSDYVHQYVGYEPSGTTFNHIHLNNENKPHNPLINSGAIILASLIRRSLDLPERFDDILREYKRICGYQTMGFNNSVFMSEKATADRNYALAYFMSEHKCFPTNTKLVEILELYFQLCSLEVNTDSMAVIASTLANGGKCPTTDEKVLSPESVRDTLSLMHSCGMYDYSGQFAFKCGLPCKSGVSGSCLLVIPNVMGIGLWSPPLDKQGNSCRSLQFAMSLETIRKKYVECKRRKM